MVALILSLGKCCWNNVNIDLSSWKEILEEKTINGPINENFPDLWILSVKKMEEDNIVYNILRP